MDGEPLSPALAGQLQHALNRLDYGAVHLIVHAGHAMSREA